MRPRVLLDVDGVLADFHTPCLQIINGLTGAKHKVEDFDDWDIFKALKVTKEVEQKTYDLMNLPGWCRSIEPYDDAYTGVSMLREIADIFICTSPMKGDTWVSERNKWLSSHFGFSTKQIIHTSAKHVCAGDALIDDRISNLVAWKKAHPNGSAIRWAMPHLKSHDYDGPTADTWEHVIGYVTEQAEMLRLLQPRTWHHE